MIETDTNPGVRGQTRSTWRDATHLRGLLMKLIRLNPEAERDELEEMYLSEAKGPKFHAAPAHEAFLDEALRRAFDNDYALCHRPARPPRQKTSAADVAALVETIKTVVLLDLVQPNGKKLRDCTGKECRAAGGWLTEIGARVGDRGVVGEQLSEAEVAKIRDGARKK